MPRCATITLYRTNRGRCSQWSGVSQSIRCISVNFICLHILLDNDTGQYSLLDVDPAASRVTTDPTTTIGAHQLDCNSIIVVVWVWWESHPCHSMLVECLPPTIEPHLAGSKPSPAQSVPVTLSLVIPIRVASSR